MKILSTNLIIIFLIFTLVNTTKINESPKKATTNLIIKPSSSKNLSTSTAGTKFITPTNFSKLANTNVKNQTEETTTVKKKFFFNKISRRGVNLIFGNLKDVNYNKIKDQTQTIKIKTALDTDQITQIITSTIPTNDKKSIINNTTKTVINADVKTITALVQNDKALPISVTSTVKESSKSELMITPIQRNMREVLLNPNKIADPSLETITLLRPDYRAISTTINPLLSDGLYKEKSSSTIISMSDSDFNPFNKKPTILETQTTPFITATPFIFTSQQSSENNEFSYKKILDLKLRTTTISTTAEELDSKSENSVVVVHDKVASDVILNALKETLGSDLPNQLLFKNITIILPNFNPPPQAFFDSILTKSSEMSSLPYFAGNLY